MGCILDVGKFHRYGKYIREIVSESAHHSSSPEFVSVAVNAGTGGGGVAEVIVGTMSTLLYLLSISVTRDHLFCSKTNLLTSPSRLCWFDLCRHYSLQTTTPCR